MQYRRDIGTARGSAAARGDDSSEDLERAAAALERGELVVFPTETLYAIGCHALRADAVERLRAAKRARRGQGHRGGDRRLRSGRPSVRPRLARRATADGALLAGRPHHPLAGPAGSYHPPRPRRSRRRARLGARRWRGALARAIAAPSLPERELRAELSPRATSPPRGVLGDRVAAYLDDGPIAGAPSTLVDPGPPLRILRAGAVSRDDIDAALA